MGKTVEHVGDDDPPEAVDINAEIERAVDDAVASEQEHDAECLHQRWRKERQQRHRAEDALARHHRPAHRIGKGIGKQHGDRRGGRCYGQAVADDLGELRAVDVPDVVAKADAIGGHEAHLEDADERRHDEDQQRHHDHDDQCEHGDPVRIELRDKAGCGGGGAHHPGASCSL